MGISYGPKIVTDGLILSLDAGDTNSYPGSGNTWYDLSGNGYHHTLYNNPTFTNDSKFELNGSNGFTYLTAIPGSGNCTVVVFYKTTDTQELWVKGNDGGYYISAAYPGSGYYSQNSGSLINYIDLVVVTDPIAGGYKDGNYHMWEAKNVNFSGWNQFNWFLYGGDWNLIGTVAKIMVYNRTLTSNESRQNYNAIKTRFQ
jgi:hypothetical protein